MASKSKILVACLALLLVLSVGYALFSDTITINGTATAKGSFSIGHSCEVDEELSNGTGTCGFENDIIKTNSTLDAPDSIVVFNVVLTNNGTIPAVLKTVDSSNTKAMDYKTAGDKLYFDETSFLSAYFDLNSGENSYIGDSTAEAANIVLQPNESVTVKIVHGWAAADKIGFETQPELPEDGASISYNVAFGFEQITVQ